MPHMQITCQWSHSLITDGCVHLATAIWHIRDDQGITMEYESVQLMILDGMVPWPLLDGVALPPMVRQGLQQLVLGHLENMG